MDYKQIIKSRGLRLMLLRFCCFIPDELMLKIQYRIKTKNKLNLKYPTRYTEKIQWYKIYYKDQLMIRCVDKYDVREYVKSCGLSKILNECYGVYENTKEINFNCLPDAFVVKDTLGGGGNSVIIVEKISNSINEKCIDFEKFISYSPSAFSQSLHPYKPEEAYHFRSIFLSETVC